MVFQDPYSSLNPRQTVRKTLEAPLRLHGVTSTSEVDDRIADVLKHVGLRPDQAERFRMSSQAVSASASVSRAR